MRNINLEYLINLDLPITAKKILITGTLKEKLFECAMWSIEFLNCEKYQPKFQPTLPHEMESYQNMEPKAKAELNRDFMNKFWCIPAVKCYLLSLKSTEEHN